MIDNEARNGKYHQWRDAVKKSLYWYIQWGQIPFQYKDTSTKKIPVMSGLVSSDHKFYPWVFWRIVFMILRVNKNLQQIN